MHSIIRSIVKKVKAVAICMVICTLSDFAAAQTPVVGGQQYYYTFYSYGGQEWWYIEAENGTVTNQGINSGVPYAYVVWSCAGGPGLVRYVEYHSENGQSSSQHNVSISSSTPTVYTVSGGGSYCGSGTVTLSGSQSNVNYQLKKNGVSEGSVVAGTGAGLSWPGMLTGTYTVVATNANGSCATAMNGSPAISISAATVGGTVSGSTEQYGIASGTLTLSGHTGSVIRWEKNEGSGWTTISHTSTTYPYANVVVTTQYRAIVKSGTCAEADSSPATVTIFPSPQITINGSTYVSYGTSTQLSTTTYHSYQWKKAGVDISGATAQTLTVKEPGTYTVTVKGSATAPPVTSGSATIFSTVANQVVNMASITRILKEGVNEATSLYTLQPNELMQTIAYQDGLGRTFQTVMVGASPGSGDVVRPAGYSKNGLADTTFLPYVAASADGRLRLNAIRNAGSYTTSEQYQFYQNTPKVAHDNYPFARTVYRNTPDAKVTEQGAPGADWQPGSNHTIRNITALNNATTYRVRYWKADGTTNSNYPDNSVMVSITTDENGNKTRTFVNVQGQMVLKQVQMDETLEGVATPWLETYYIYDNFGRLIYQVPPKAMKVLGTGASLNANASSVNELIYKYTYDNRNRLLIKKEPGATEQHFVYDNLDRLVFTQDGNLRSQNRWTFVKYDRYNRVVYTGVYNRNVTRTTLQGEMDLRNYDTEPYFDAEQVNATYHGYSNQVYPTTNLTVLAVNYYDHYDFDRNGTPDYSYDNGHITGQDSAASTQIRGMATGSKQVTINEAGTVTANWLVSAVFYDDYGRPIQTQSNNHLYLTVADKSTVIYDFAGKALKTKTTHCQGAGSCVNLVDRPEYDHAGRVLNLFRKINNDAEVHVVQYEYNALGQLVDKKLHNTGGENFLQSVDFRYTIRGWLKSINNGQLTVDNNNDDTNDYFGMELIYNQSESGLSNTQYYNGNISAIKWKGIGGGSGAEDQRSYKYVYDKSDRLKTATFQAHSGSAWSKEVNTLNENLTYDHNGNIKTLVRNQDNRGFAVVNGLPTVTSTAQAIDNLTYTYASNYNRLTKVEDASGQDKGFNNGANVTTEYTYNNSGSLTSDLNKGIGTNGITYNMLGKPRVVNFTDGRKVEYVYSASGAKLTMKTWQGTTLLSTTNYSGSFVYEGTAPQLSFFGSPEGRVVKKGSNFEYEYAIADHQGNTRVVFSSVTPSSQSITANFETSTNEDFENYGNRVNWELFDHTDAGDDGTDYSQKLTGGNNSQIGVAKSYKVYPGEKIKIEAYGKYYNAQSTGSNITAFAAALTGAFGLSSSSTGEALKAYNALENYGSFIAVGGSGGSSGNPKLFVNILLFDKDHKFVDAAWQQIDGGEQIGVSPKAAHDYMMQEVTVKEAGYAYVYLSNENPTLVEFYVDDVTITHTPTNVIQYNEYYPFGLQTANSWTREDAAANNYLYNSGSELNSVTSNYEMHYREYDVALGRMNAVDPMASKFGSITPYNYSFNSPAIFNDPTGAVPEYSNHLYAHWRLIDGIHAVMEGGGGSGNYMPAHIPMYGVTNYRGPTMRDMVSAANAVRSGQMTVEEYAALFGTKITNPEHIRLLISGADISIGKNSITVDKLVQTGVPNPYIEIGGIISTGNFVITKTIYLNSRRPGKIELAGSWNHFVGLFLNVSDDVISDAGETFKRLQAESDELGWGHDYSKEATKVNKTYRAVKWGGRALAVYNIADIEVKYRNGEINGIQRFLEQGTNAYSTFGGIYGAAWGIGWETGRWITSLEGYQAWKYDTWLPWRETYLGY
jgi:RHS repeat-associated protein